MLLAENGELVAVFSGLVGIRGLQGFRSISIDGVNALHVFLSLA